MFSSGAVPSLLALPSPVSLPLLLSILESEYGGRCPLEDLRLRLDASSSQLEDLTSSLGPRVARVAGALLTAEGPDSFAARGAAALASGLEDGRGLTSVAAAWPAGLDLPPQFVESRAMPVLQELWRSGGQGGRGEVRLMGGGIVLDPETYSRAWLQPRVRGSLRGVQKPTPLSRICELIAPPPTPSSGPSYPHAAFLRAPGPQHSPPALPFVTAVAEDLIARGEAQGVLKKDPGAASATLGLSSPALGLSFFPSNHLEGDLGLLRSAYAAASLLPLARLSAAAELHLGPGKGAAAQLAASAQRLLGEDGIVLTPGFAVAPSAAAALAAALQLLEASGPGGGQAAAANIGGDPWVSCPAVVPPGLDSPGEIRALLKHVAPGISTLDAESGPALLSLGTGASAADRASSSRARDRRAAATGAGPGSSLVLLPQGSYVVPRAIVESLGGRVVEEARREAVKEAERALASGAFLQMSDDLSLTPLGQRKKQAGAKGAAGDSGKGAAQSKASAAGPTPAESKINARWVGLTLLETCALTGVGGDSEPPFLPELGSVLLAPARAAYASAIHSALSMAADGRRDLTEAAVAELSACHRRAAVLLAGGRQLMGEDAAAVASIDRHVARLVGPDLAALLLRLAWLNEGRPSASIEAQLPYQGPTLPTGHPGTRPDPAALIAAARGAADRAFCDAIIALLWLSSGPDLDLGAGGEPLPPPTPPSLTLGAATPMSLLDLAEAAANAVGYRLRRPEKKSDLARCAREYEIVLQGGLSGLLAAPPAPGPAAAELGAKVLSGIIPLVAARSVLRLAVALPGRYLPPCIDLLEGEGAVAADEIRVLRLFHASVLGVLQAGGEAGEAFNQLLGAWSQVRALV